MYKSFSGAWRTGVEHNRSFSLSNTMHGSLSNTMHGTLWCPVHVVWHSDQSGGLLLMHTIIPESPRKNRTSFIVLGARNLLMVYTFLPPSPTIYTKYMHCSMGSLTVSPTNFLYPLEGSLKVLMCSFHLPLNSMYALMNFPRPSRS